VPDLTPFHLNAKMRSPSTLLVAATLSAFVTSAAASTPGVVGFEFTKSRVLARDHPQLARRQSNTVYAALDNYLILYGINVRLPSVKTTKNVDDCPLP
jgi:hypothetical protein